MASCQSSASLLPPAPRRAAVVTQDGLPLSVDVPIPHVEFHVGHGEQHKSLATVGELCRGWPASASRATTS